MFNLERRLLLIASDDKDIERIQRLIVRTGHSEFAGYLAGGMKAWETAGLPLERMEQVTVQQLHDLHSKRSRMTVLDVRGPDEWQSGHIPNAEHHFIAEMRDRVAGLDKDHYYVTYCASG